MSAERVPYLYIAGASFSGSTLLAFLLNSHPAIASVSEVCGVLPNNANASPDYYRCSCGAQLYDCPFYGELRNRIRAMGSTFDLRDWATNFQVSSHRLLDIPLTRSLRFGPLELIRDRLAPLVPGYRSTLAPIATRNLHFARATLAITGKRVFADAQKDPARIRFLAGMSELDLRVVHLVREARGSTASYMKHNPANDAERAARKWVRVNRDTERARRYVPESRWMTLRYDHLCRDHQATFDRIADFVGVERAALPADFYETEHHIVGNQMRLQARREVVEDASWKRRLKDDDLGRIARIAGPTNRRYGFDWP